MPRQVSGVFMTMGPQKFPPPISENFGEFNDWKRGASSGIFGKFPGRATRLRLLKKEKNICFFYTLISITVLVYLCPVS